MTDITLGNETKGHVRLCPECGSASIEETTKGIMQGQIDDNRATCVCGWEGIVEDLVTAEFSHEMGSDANIIRALTNDMRGIMAQHMAEPVGRFLLKWGFLQVPVRKEDLGRYMGAIAKAVLTSVLEERKKIEGERHG